MAFNNMKRLDVEQGSADWYEVDELIYDDGTSPRLRCLQAGTYNKGYMNAKLRGGQSPLKLLKRQTRDLSTANRERNRLEKELFSEHVVIGWENVRDDDDQKVPFSADACAEFLQAMPDWMFDSLYTFAANPANFTREAIELRSVTEGNSPSASSGS